jgi:hypothetical protein
MNDALEFVVWMVALVILAFLCAGEPDMFDAIRDAGMRYFSGVCR